MDESLMDAVDKFIADLRQLKIVPISAPYIASEILNSFPHVKIFTTMEATAAYMGIAQVAREALRKRHDEEYDPKNLLQQSLDLPETKLLNGGYSVKKSGEYIYIPIEQLEREDMEYICAKFDALAIHAARHSRALRAYWERRHSADAA